MQPANVTGMPESTRVLVVDDDAQIRELLSNYLQDYSFSTVAVANGAEMRQALADSAFDVILLDLMMPGEDGLSLCRSVRMTSNVPIIMLTARGESIDRVLGLELGADDYVVKPFDPRELVARIHSVLRRTQNGQLAAPVSQQDEVKFNGWKLNTRLHQLVSLDGLVIPLSNAEFRLLWVFVENPGRVLNRDQLMDQARGRMVEAFDRSIDLLVSRLRQKLQDDPKNPELIKTMRGEGYYLDAKVTR